MVQGWIENKKTENSKNHNSKNQNQNQNSQCEDDAITVDETNECKNTETPLTNSKLPDASMTSTSTVNGLDNQNFASYVRESIWDPTLNAVRWVSEHNATVNELLTMTRDVGGGILGSAFVSLQFILQVIGFGLGWVATSVLFFLFLNTMLTNDVDELKVVVLLLYPVTSWKTESGRDKIETITNSLRHKLEGVLFVPLSLSSLYAAHQLCAITILNCYNYKLPGAGTYISTTCVTNFSKNKILRTHIFFSFFCFFFELFFVFFLLFTIFI